MKELLLEEPELTDEELESKILKETFFDDLLTALYEVRLAAPLFALLGLFLAYHLTIAPYRSSVRPILSKPQLVHMQQITLRAETELRLPFPSNDTIKFKFHSAVNKHGNFRLPDMFYHGVTFGLTSENSHALEFTGMREFQLKNLKSDLLTMHPKPTHIMRRSAFSNSTGWHERGYAVYFSYEDLESQGKLSSDVTRPWKRVNEDVLEVARKYLQTYVTVWYPNTFGKVTAPKNSTGSKLVTAEVDSSSGGSGAHKLYNKIDTEEFYRYTNIIQSVLPTRTGLNDIKSDAVVWLSRVNDTEPVIPPKMLQKDWTEDYHWTKYSRKERKRT